MANEYFKFKQFTIWQNQCAMKVGTDGVLLGAWADVVGAKNILDIGCGTGLIALMLAQRGDSVIDAIDIDEGAYRQSVYNVANSPFADRISVVHSSLNDFISSNTKRYDLIVSNPPYFNFSLKSPDSQRNLARHSDTLPLTELVKSSKQLLNRSGRIVLILPIESENALLEIARSNDLFPHKTCYILPTPSSKPKRILMELSEQSVVKNVTSQLIIESSRHQYSEEFTSLAKKYYLKL